jgi:hypothetical protein
MDVLVFVYVCAFFCVSWSPVQGVLPTVPDQETEETQPYAPKAGAGSQVWEQRGRIKNGLLSNSPFLVSSLRTHTHTHTHTEATRTRNQETITKNKKQNTRTIGSTTHSIPFYIISNLKDKIILKYFI